MRHPPKAGKSYLALFKEKGLSSALKAVVLVIAVSMYSDLIQSESLTLTEVLAIYFLGCVYFTWKGRLTRFLRNVLRGKGSAIKGMTDKGR